MRGCKNRYKKYPCGYCPILCWTVYSYRKRIRVINWDAGLAIRCKSCITLLSWCCSRQTWDDLHSHSPLPVGVWNICFPCWSGILVNYLEAHWMWLKSLLLCDWENGFIVIDEEHANLSLLFNLHSVQINAREFGSVFAGQGSLCSWYFLLD